MSEKPYLKWLFRVQFADDSTYNQTPDDKSVLLEGKSEFYDMLEAEKAGKKIRFFSLCERGTNNVVTVDLGTGLFFVNKLPIILESDKLPKIPEKFDLIFYRQTNQHVNVTYDKKSGEATQTQPAGSDTEYFIGWECEIAGRKYMQKLAVA